MSEYQYYEFQAIDQPLTVKEMSQLRSYSTRARITSTSFINDYSWGDFKGNENNLMAKYFDAFLYLANWGTHVVKLRLPKSLLNPKIAKLYCNGDMISLRENSKNIILSFMAEDEHHDDAWIDPVGYLSSLISIRSDLVRGDIRVLYLGWLLRVQNGEIEENELEPPVPAGLGELHAPLQSFVDFLRVDFDLLQAAAITSAPMETSKFKRSDVQDWVSTLPVDEKDNLVTDGMLGSNITNMNKLLQRFHKEHVNNNHSAEERPRRTVSQLLTLSEDLRKKRKLAEKKNVLKKRCDANIKKKRVERNI